MHMYHSNSSHPTRDASGRMMKKGGKRSQPQDTDRGARSGIGSSKEGGT